MGTVLSWVKTPVDGSMLYSLMLLPALFTT